MRSRDGELKWPGSCEVEEIPQARESEFDGKKKQSRPSQISIMTSGFVILLLSKVPCSFIQGKAQQMKIFDNLVSYVP
jgi:hypothetical protein